MKTLHYVGMDVHKETIDVVVFQEDERGDGREVSRARGGNRKRLSEIGVL